MRLGRRGRPAPRGEADLVAMRAAGRVVAEMHEAVRAAAVPGVSTAALDGVGREVLAERGATSNFLGYHGFPGVICASVNDVVVHGIPRADVVLAPGDLLSVDCGAVVDGWHGDAAFTMAVEELCPVDEALVTAADAALAAAVAAAVDGGHLGDIGAAVGRAVASRDVSVVEGYTGHGIGTAMHEEPPVPNTGRSGRGPKLVTGVTLAIEPILATGTSRTRTLADGWTVVTDDGSRAAHVEHTVMVGPDGPEILTRR